MPSLSAAGAEPAREPIHHVLRVRAAVAARERARVRPEAARAQRAQRLDRADPLPGALEAREALPSQRAAHLTAGTASRQDEALKATGGC